MTSLDDRFIGKGFEYLYGKFIPTCQIEKLHFAAVYRYAEQQYLKKWRVSIGINTAFCNIFVTSCFQIDNHFFHIRHTFLSAISRRWGQPHRRTFAFVSVQEIVIIVNVGKIVLCSCLSAERFAVCDFLEIVQTAGNTTVTVAVESIETNACSAVNTAVNL